MEVEENNRFSDHNSHEFETKNERTYRISIGRNRRRRYRKIDKTRDRVDVADPCGLCHAVLPQFARTLHTR